MLASFWESFKYPRFSVVLNMTLSTALVVGWQRSGFGAAPAQVNLVRSAAQNHLLPTLQVCCESFYRHKKLDHSIFPLPPQPRT